MGNEIEDIKGKAKEEVGEATGNEDLEREGELDQASASVKDALDDATDAVKDGIESIKDKLS